MAGSLLGLVAVYPRWASPVVMGVEKRGGPSGAQVEVIQAQQVGIYDVQVVTAET